MPDDGHAKGGAFVLSAGLTLAANPLIPAGCGALSIHCVAPMAAGG